MDFNNIHKFSELLDLHEPMKEVKDKLLGTYIELNGEIVLFADVTAVGNKGDVLVAHKLGSSFTYESTSTFVEKIESISFVD